MFNSDDEPLKPKRRSKTMAADSDDEPISNLNGRRRPRPRKFRYQRPSQNPVFELMMTTTSNPISKVTKMTIFMRLRFGRGDGYT
jgi:hypothetical protein